MILDSHTHFWKYDPQTYSWISPDMETIRRDFYPDDLATELGRHQVDACIAVQVEQHLEETRRLLHHAKQHEFIKAVVGWVDLGSAEAEADLDTFIKNPRFRGVRHTVYDQKGEFMLEPGFQRGISLLQDRQLSFDILVFEYQLEGAIKLVRQFPEQTFILNHLGKPGMPGPSATWKKSMRALGEMPYVYCKISGFLAQAAHLNWKKEDFWPYFELVTQAFGEDRLIWGSDWPVCLAAGNFRAAFRIVWEYFQENSAREKIFSKNAMAAYRLAY